MKKRLLSTVIVGAILLIGTLSCSAQKDTVSVNLAEKLGLTSGIFGPLSTFGKNQVVVSLAKDLVSNTRLKEHDYDKVKFPSTALIIEKGVRSNLGIGIGIGYHQWHTPQYNYYHHYFPISFRTCYHFNFHKSLDTYVGGAISFRNMIVSDPIEKTSERNLTYNFFTSLHGVIGARWYPTARAGLFLEYGNDLTSFMRLGLVFRFTKTETNE